MCVLSSRNILLKQNILIQYMYMSIDIESCIIIMWIVGDVAICMTSAKRVGEELKLWETPACCGELTAMRGVPILY